MEVAKIYTKFHEALFAFIRSRISSREDAEDILHNVFLKISSGIEGLADEEKLQSWVYSITRNTIIDYYRKNANRRMSGIDSNLEETLPEQPDTDNKKNLDQCIASMIELLPEDYRGIITDSEIKEIKQKDLTEKYGIAYPSVRSRVQRGRERLKQLFYNCCQVETDVRGNVMNVSRNLRDGACGCDTCDDKK
jgi:RNA polymerase sigma-70 factor, ECF subfamily